jgi:agmatine deiminase
MTHPVDMRHYRMPAEWQPHRGTILTWPHRPEIWRGVHPDVEATFARLCMELSQVEEVHINVPHLEYRDYAQKVALRAGANAERLVWHQIDSDDVWARDHGPMFVVRRQEAPPETPPLAMVDWEFNAWGGKFASELDNQIPRRMNAFFAVPHVAPGLVMEGGALEVNGVGDLLTTEAVLLNSNRNPDFSREEIETSLRLSLGVQRLHWLGAGLEGDDTDGHIDDIARFVAEDAIVAVAAAPGHPDHEALSSNLARLRQLRGGGNDRPFRVGTLPSPEPISFRGEHLPASYANFYIANGIVLAPVFMQRADNEALALLQAMFPDRRVIAIDGRPLVTQYGNIHCVTQQIPLI